jgi:molybdopterin molybdotransferase
LTRAGARFFFGRVAIQPGKPVAFGQVSRGASGSEGYPLPFLALPGNPISTAVTFQLFAAPLLAGLAGCTEVLPRFALAQFTGTWQGRPGLTRFLPAACDFSASPQVRLVPWQGSGDLAALASSNCFVAIAEEAESIDDGSIVPILLT